MFIDALKLQRGLLPSINHCFAGQVRQIIGLIFKRCPILKPLSAKLPPKSETAPHPGWQDGTILGPGLWQCSLSKIIGVNSVWFGVSKRQIWGRFLAIYHLLTMQITLRAFSAVDFVTKREFSLKNDIVYVQTS